MKRYQVTYYCPDQHIEYDIRTLDQIGVGGGITARIRIAHALAKEGHDVTLFVNCRKDAIIQRVKYVHFSKMIDVGGDVFIATTSGGNLDLSDIPIRSICSRLKVLMLHGCSLPSGISPDDFDFFYAPSHFVMKSLVDNGINPAKIKVFHHGIEEENFQSVFDKPRDLHSLVYLSHPSKGLNAAMEVLKILRKDDLRFSLHSYGGNKLWGESENPSVQLPGVIDHGLIGQKQLAKQLMTLGFSMNLQSREEPFGMAITDSMRAGCIVLASPVGAYPEIIKDGVNGFLIAGDHEDPITHTNAAQLIIQLLADPFRMKKISEAAKKAPSSWKAIANLWEKHWDSLLKDY